jgi:hypothetical protein
MRSACSSSHTGIFYSSSQTRQQNIFTAVLVLSFSEVGPYKFVQYHPSVISGRTNASRQSIQIDVNFAWLTQAGALGNYMSRILLTRVHAQDSGKHFECFFVEFFFFFSFFCTFSSIELLAIPLSSGMPKQNGHVFILISHIPVVNYHFQMAYDEQYA